MYKNFAEVYDSFMEYCDYQEWRKQIYSILKKNGRKGNTLLEIGCGTGNLLLTMADKYSCVGLDISQEMLEVAKKKLEGREILLYKEDMKFFNLNRRFDLIVAIFDTVTHLLNNKDLVSHFESIKNHLSKDGVYIFDMVDRKFMTEMFPGGIFADVRENLTVIWEHELHKGIDYIDAVYFVKEDKDLYKKYEESYEKKLFTTAEIEVALKKAGLKILERVESNRVAGKREFYAVVAE